MGVVCMNAFKKPDLIPFYTEALEFLYRPNRIFFFNFYCINYQKSQAEKSFLSFLAGQMALRGRSSSMGSNFSPPSLFVIACSWMWMGSHEPARMLWCRWFIHVVSSKSASRKTCECPLSHLRRWRGRSIDGKVSLIPDPCLLHVLEKDPEPKTACKAALLVWEGTILLFTFWSMCGYKSCEFKSLHWLQTGSPGYWGNAVPFMAIVLSI